MGRLSRLIAGCAGVAVAVFGAAALLMSLRGAPPDGLFTDPAAALVPAGLGLLLRVLPVSHRIAGRVVHGFAHLLMVFAAAIGVLGLAGHPGPAIATLVAIAALVLLGHLLRTLQGAERRQRRLVGELEDREKFAATLLQSMNEAVMVMDANYHVIDVNRRWRELTGHAADEPVRFDPPPVPPSGSSGDWLLPRLDGGAVPVLAAVAPVPDEQGTPRAYVATYVDIADRKRAEETLSEHAAELERGNTMLREANARLEAALTFKNDLTSMLTHDVAQPISSIASLAELLRADWDDLPDDIRLELATKIDKNTQRLIKMLNDLQLLFRLDMGSVTARRAPVPLREVAEAVAAASSAGEEVRVAIAEGLSALADRGHVTAVLQNLVNNAVAYGSPPIELSAERLGETVELTVRDNGPGIPDDLLPNLFGRFMRGAGLGLFIVRHLAEANGGSVRYEHATPQGARLVVTFELAPV
ncbi:sensor histidine kinase [Paractinoplanes deccanensis]|uniref:sensor histidine kinase n=1 Tax=Paractinoplanes deccanensis TaxID=113561 RepID=UPI001EF1E7F1|nr:PAS domain-containing sensor histidine kinase [Actinoplanes deccanensis]